MHAYAYVCRKCDAYTRSGSGVDSVGDGLHAGYGVEGGERGGGGRETLLLNPFHRFLARRFELFLWRAWSYHDPTVTL